MQNKLRKVKHFIKRHKKELIITAVSVVGVGVVYAITKKTPKIDTISVVDSVSTIEEIEIPELELGTITELWREDWGTNAIVNDITVADLGKFGEELTKIDGVTPDTVVSGFISLLE